MSALTNPTVQDWEFRWAPYDLPTYQLVLDQLSSHDIILEIGAGDLRLARKMADIVHQVYALEINRSILDEGLASFYPLPANLIPICGDARTFDFPNGTHRWSPAYAALHALSIIRGKIAQGWMSDIDHQRALGHECGNH